MPPSTARAGSPVTASGSEGPVPRESEPGVWRLPSRALTLDRPAVMGILNVTPDSFSDGGEIRTVADAVDRAARMLDEGATLLDVGGESTRPGADRVPTGVELDRVVPVVTALTERFDTPVSVDTRDARVAEEAIDAGASIVNDVSGFVFDERMSGVAARAGVGVVLMHMRGTPRTMQRRADYDDVTREVRSELEAAVGRATEAGVLRDRIVVDPGIGFAKRAQHSLTLLAELAELRTLGRPILVGPSRKSFLGELLGVPPAERVAGTVSACVIAYLAGARLFRVHDVKPVAEALRVARAIREARAAVGRD